MEIAELIIFSIYVVLESVVLTFFTAAFVGLTQKKKEKKAGGGDDKRSS